MELRRPDDLHVHFRDGDALSTTVPEIAAVFSRAVAMPNLVPPIRTVSEALAYRARLVTAATDAGHPAFEPFVSLYLTETTRPEEIAAAKAAGLIAAKLYPAGATTHSDAGVRDPAAIDDVLAAMEEHGLVLQIHGEVTDPDVDVFDREAAFVARVLTPLLGRFPRLRVVLEHVTSRAGVALVEADRSGRLAASVTPQHLAYDRSALFAGGLRPHLYCLPVPKTRQDRDALAAVVVAGDPRFFLGSDSAPHPRHRKEAACCAAGVYSGPAVLSHYAEIFEDLGCLERLDAFASAHGADFYGLPRNPGRLALVRAPSLVPASRPLGGAEAVPWRAGESLRWTVEAG
jgi:dihydroorotase